MIHHKQQQASPSSESGFTIIESLVAIVIAAILLSAIAPVIILSVATRVQAKRIETATDAAKTYLDGVKSGTITVPPTTGESSGTPIKVNDYNAPSLGTLNCSTNAYCSAPSTDLYCIDGDGGGCSISSVNDLVIQAFRYNKATVITGGVTTNITDPAQGYQLGIRVYRADGFKSDGVNLKKAPSKQNTFAAGVGDRKSPLVEMTTEITNTATTFENFCNRLKDTANTDSNTACN
ncbi:prepilin-type N-terminal cleavage/methylation domain-containing protein [Nostoc minutum NIES-26]|uniref:Prepilin-type N-terminal cleavage/methylation domain-containing protein n=1 Tax=Nostoc minutum NIES-26 TaxID=1844469 RepID=A0A367R0P7_9NOSO|nr:prepilin-type N-terminal cleavage/methylation domain-containing protein [Nostoc minutum NIES-26]